MSEESAAQEILRYEREVNEALVRLRKRGYEAATVDTPLDSVLASEDGMLDEWGIRTETVRRLFDYFLGDGPHPAQVLRRVYAIGSHMGIKPFNLLNLRDRAKMLGDSHGSQHWRMKKICIDPLLRAGAHSVKAPGQKGLAAQAAAAEAQKGNTNRAKSAKKKTKPHHHHEIQKTEISKARPIARRTAGSNHLNGSANDNVVVGGRSSRHRAHLSGRGGPKCDENGIVDSVCYFEPERVSSVA